VPNPSKGPGPTDGEIYRRALALGLAGVAGVALITGLQAGPATRVASFFRRFSSPQANAAPVQARAESEHLSAEPLTEELRKKGFHECFPHDPIGLGPYSAMKNLSMGRIAIPQKGGHTEDFGYDVLIQFHGHSPVRKTFVQVAKGLVFVGIDRGIGSGPYSDAFANPDVFPTLVHSIEAALRKHSGEPKAHIRHLALSAWSAGYGAVNEILKHGDQRIDAVVLLDGLHAAWNPAVPNHDAGVPALSSMPLTPTFKFAKRAAAGEKLFVFTHSEVTPDGYPSTRQTAELLLSELGLARTAVSPGDDKFGQTSTADQQGFHLWGFRGTNELAHCSHIPHVARAVHLLEDTWATPAMDRSVPFTPAPVVGTGDAGVEPAEPALAVVQNPLAAALAAEADPTELLPHPAAAEEPKNPSPAEVPPKAEAPADKAPAPADKAPADKAPAAEEERPHAAE